MTEGFTLTLAAGSGWRHLGNTPESAPIEVVLRSFDRPVLFATGKGAGAPTDAPVAVPAGGGARLTGLHFFAKPASEQDVCRILVRGF